MVGDRIPTDQLHKVLGLSFGLAVVIGNSIGMGILRTPGEIAAHVPSIPLYIAVWIAGACYALLGALTVAEITAMRPLSGGLYTLIRHALGPYLGFLFGWTDWIANCATLAAVAIVLGEYLGPLVPPLSGQEATIAVLVVVGFALLQWRGVRIGDLAQQATSLIKALALIGLAVVALAMTSGSSPVAVTAVDPVAVSSGFAFAAAVVVALQAAVFTYEGWGSPVYFAEEIKQPGKNLPRAMIGGVLIVLAIYLTLNLAFIRVLSLEEMAGDPFVAATVASRLFGPGGDTVIRVLMIISLVASINALHLMGSRIPYAMSRDRLFPAFFGRVNRGGTPVSALGVGTVLALIFIATNTFQTVLALLAFFFVAMYTLAFCSLFVLRRTEPDTPRPFRVPLYPWIPGAVLLGSVAFLVASIVGNPTTGLLGLGVLLLSWPVYRIVRA